MELNELLRRIRPCVMDRPYVFISYSSLDREVVWQDVLEFQNRGYNVWLDEKNVDKSKASWKDDAEEAVQRLNCRLAVFYVSRHSLTSVPCHNEMCATRSQKARRRHNGEVKFIAVDVEPIADIVAFADGVYEELTDDFSIGQEIREQRLDALYSFKEDFFFGNNERVRVHAKNAPDRIVDYYDEILEYFPVKSRIGGGTAGQANEDGDGTDAQKPENGGVTAAQAPENADVTAVQAPENADATAAQAPENGGADGRTLYMKGAEAFDRKDYAAAVRYFRLSAEKDYPLGQCWLGWCFVKGYGKTDRAQALHWLRLAAEQGYADAQCKLGFLYDDGKEIGQDRKEAVRWYRLAAEQGYVTAQFNLGLCYEYGKGMEEKNVEEAVRLYRLAAEQGHTNAQYQLGMCYEYGKGMEKKDVEEAVRLYRLAADNGHKKAAEALKRLGRS